MYFRGLLFVIFFLSATGISFADEPESALSAAISEDSKDPEQQQLEWCFVYSNRLGYDIQYIANPRLFDFVSKWIDTPYHYAGNDEQGIDCSGFVAMIYKNVYHIDLEGGSRDIYKESTSLSRADLREGDMVFFKINPSRISHVGVYLGQNKFAHASVKSGVIISDLDEPYYQQRYFSGGRIGQ